MCTRVVAYICNTNFITLKNLCEDKCKERKPGKNTLKPAYS